MRFQVGDMEGKQVWWIRQTDKRTENSLWDLTNPEASFSHNGFLEHEDQTTLFMRVCIEATAKWRALTWPAVLFL